MSTLKVGAIRGVSASSDAITVANDGTCSAKITSNGGSQLANRNKIINGAMQVVQRGTSFTPSGTEQPYTMDRFQHIGTSGIDFDSTDTQSTDHPDGFSFSMKITPDTTDTPTGSANAAIQHRIVGQDMQDLAYGTSSAKQITLSFYAKSSSQNNGHQYGVELAHYASDGTRRLINSSFTVTSSWQRFTFTFDGDVSHDVTNTNTRGFDVNIHLASGSDDIATHTSWTTGSLFRTPTGQSNFLDNTSNEFYITGIQLERGNVATDFEHRSFAQELYLCQRYYFRYLEGNTKEIGSCWYFTSTHVSFFFEFPTTMRAVPSGTAVAGTDYYTNFRNGAADGMNSISFENGSTEQFSAFNNSNVSGTAGQCGLIRSTNASAMIEFASEL